VVEATLELLVATQGLAQASLDFGAEVNGQRLAVDL
jgi:hypothetical protein